MSCTEDELPDLCVLLGMPRSNAEQPVSHSLRRSPRKKMAGAQTAKQIDSHEPSTLTASSNLTRRIPPKLSSPTKFSKSEPRPIGLLHVDSLLLPLSKLAVQDQQHTKSPERKEIARSRTTQKASRFVLKEARCNDDEEDSMPEDAEDEETDLSGFIVDDNADLSYSEWSETDSIPNTRKALSDVKPRRRLQRGSPRRRKGDQAGHSDQEVVDLTESPEKAPKQEPRPEAVGSHPEHNPTTNLNTSLLTTFDNLLRLPPPKFDLLADVPRKQHSLEPSSQQSCAGCSTDHQRPTTPPTTPPRSPSKLKSPSKLLSPSKRDFVHRSPHRQSTDAFWDLHTINSWHDQYSPKKAPTASPGKRGLARFQIWSDDEDICNTSSESLPSPCLSPTKPRSPLKSPEKAERQRIAADKKAARARRAAFDTAKEQLALDLFKELDKSIASSKLGTLSTSTGGVKIVWSKTLRSTAGRANWRRTVTKATDSPVKGNTIPSGPGVKVEHFANIELAAKVIDSEDRLVNTLAHEFCHLANFMVSNVRDQPHGASFKAWASKVTTHLQKSENELWRKVEVTTKHSYKIDHKYLWVCVGRERTKAAEFLNLAEDEGCGAEYGRHSKSIDTEKLRCGRCKGKLAQVRPKPRESPVKNSVAQGRVKRETGKSKGDVEVLEKMMEVVELSD